MAAMSWDRSRSPGLGGPWFPNGALLVENAAVLASSRRVVMGELGMGTGLERGGGVPH